MIFKECILYICFDSCKYHLHSTKILEIPQELLVQNLLYVKNKFSCLAYFLLSQYKFLAPRQSFSSPPSPHNPTPITPFQNVWPPWVSFFPIFSTFYFLNVLFPHFLITPHFLSSPLCFQPSMSLFQPAICSFPTLCL